MKFQSEKNPENPIPALLDAYKWINQNNDRRKRIKQDLGASIDRVGLMAALYCASRGDEKHRQRNALIRATGVPKRVGYKELEMLMAKGKAAFESSLANGTRAHCEPLILTPSGLSDVEWLARSTLALLKIWCQNQD